MDLKERSQPESAGSAGRTLALYVAIGVLYVFLGIFIPELLFSWWEGVPFLLLALWIVHTLRRRLA